MKVEIVSKDLFRISCVELGSNMSKDTRSNLFIEWDECKHVSFVYDDL